MKEKEVTGNLEKEKDGSLMLVVWLYDYSDYDLICLLKSEQINLPLLTKAIIKLYSSGKRATFLLPEIKNPFGAEEIIRRRYNYIIRFYPERDDECIKMLTSIRHNMRVGFIKNLVRACIHGGFNDFYFNGEDLSKKHHAFVTAPGVPILDYSQTVKGKICSRAKDLDMQLTFSSEDLALANPDESFVSEAGKLIAEDRRAMQLAEGKAEKEKEKKRISKKQSLNNEKPRSFFGKKKPAVVKEEESTDNEPVDIFSEGAVPANEEAKVEKPKTEETRIEPKPIAILRNVKESLSIEPVEAEDLSDLFSGITVEY